MNFTWIKNEIATPTVTIYESNLTLNKVACEHFNDIRFVLLGIDENTNQIAIKPINKESIDLGLYSASQLHKISIGKSYGRISNKTFIKGLSAKYQLDFTSQNGVKYDAFYNDKENILVIQL